MFLNDNLLKNHIFSNLQSQGPAKVKTQQLLSGLYFLYTCLIPRKGRSSLYFGNCRSNLGEATVLLTNSENSLLSLPSLLFLSYC